MVATRRSTSAKPTRQQKKQQIYYQQQQIQGPSQIRYQKKKAQDAKELFEYIGINQPNSSNNTKWKNFTNALRASVYQLYVEKAKQYAKKIQEITTDNQMTEFVKFLDDNIRHTSQTTQTITNLKKELLVKFGDKNFELILGKFNKNNECNNIIQNLKKDYGITELSSLRFTRQATKFVEKLKPRHKELYKTLKKIYDKNIGLSNYLGILNMLLVFSVKPEFLTNRQTPLYINYAITGLPGTGKSYIASLLGEILQHSGILLKNKFSTLESFDFIGEYVGQSGPKTYNTLLKNMESVVFIDEVYNIARCNGDMVQNTKECKPKKNKKCDQVKCTKFDSYSTEACTEIVKFISENPGCIAIIVAGYEDGDLGVKNTFFKINEGLSRRFPAENRIKMKPVLKEDAIAKVKATLEEYNIHNDQIKELQLQSSNLYTLFEKSLLKLNNGYVLKENFSSLNRIVKDFIQWLTLKNMTNINVTRESAKEKISKLFASNTFNKMDQNNEKITQKYLTAKEKQAIKRQQQRKL